MIATSKGSDNIAGREDGAQIFPQGKLLAFVLVTVIFFLWGMSNNLTDILVQQFKKSFELSLLKAQLVQTAVFLAYGTMAIPAALLMRRFGYKTGILAGLACFGMGTFLFWPAAVVGSYTPFLLALFLAGCGQSILETACNPFIAQFGPAATSERRLNFSQAFNPVGCVTGVLIGTRFIFSGVEKQPAEVAAMKAAGTYGAYLHTEIMRVVPTYVGLAAVVFLLAVFIGRTKFPDLSTAAAGESEQTGSFRELLRFKGLWLAVAAMFFYNGAQAATWSNFIPYMKEYTTLSERSAGYYLTGTLVALAVGRFASTALMRHVNGVQMMRVYGVINVVLLIGAVLKPGMGGALMILATSFFMSIMFPTIFALGVKGLGHNTKLGGSFLVMGIVGGAIFPPLVGAVKALTGSLAMGYVLPAICFGVVALYGFVSSSTTMQEVESAPIV